MIYPSTLWKVAQEYIKRLNIFHATSGALIVQGGDVLTTYIGIYELGLAELNPYVRVLLSTTGILGLFGIKLAWMIMTLAGATIVDNPRRVIKCCCLMYILVGGIGLVNNAVIVLTLLLA